LHPCPSPASPARSATPDGQHPLSRQPARVDQAIPYSRTVTVHPHARGDDVPCCSAGVGAPAEPGHRPTRASLLPGAARQSRG
jgi:hypothetical protein